jgi:hypothetical protein
MTLELQRPDDPAEDAPPALAVVERVVETRDICRRYIDGLVAEERKPGLPFATHRNTLTGGQDDILAAERLARRQLRELQQ